MSTTLINANNKKYETFLEEILFSGENKVLFKLRKIPKNVSIKNVNEIVVEKKRAIFSAFWICIKLNIAIILKEIKKINV